VIQIVLSVKPFDTNLLMHAKMNVKNYLSNLDDLNIQSYYSRHVCRLAIQAARSSTFDNFK